MRLRNALSVINNSIRQYKIITPTLYHMIGIMDIAGCNYDGSIDHIAFRSFKSNGGIYNISEVLLKDGYFIERDTYEFPEKHLTAKWYSPTIEELPTVFVSQINEEKLSLNSQEIITSYTRQNSKRRRFDGVSRGSELWGPVLSSDYYKLSKESEYAAWTLAFGYSLNHITIPVHNLSKYNNIIDFNNLLLNNSIRLLGHGEIQISEDRKILQGSTLADDMKVLHHGSELISVPGTFVEFIERKYIDSGIRREGFDVSNANNIFESTYLRNV